jgi:hypothetical protein
MKMTMKVKVKVTMNQRRTRGTEGRGWKRGCLTTIEQESQFLEYGSVCSSDELFKRFSIYQTQVVVLVPFFSFLPRPGRGAGDEVFLLLMLMRDISTQEGVCMYTMTQNYRHRRRSRWQRWQRWDDYQVVLRQDTLSYANGQCVSFWLSRSTSIFTFILLSSLVTLKTSGKVYLLVRA